MKSYTEYVTDLLRQAVKTNGGVFHVRTYEMVFKEPYDTAMSLGSLTEGVAIRGNRHMLRNIVNAGLRKAALRTV